LKNSKPIKKPLLFPITELEEEHSAEDGYFADLDKVNKANVQKRLKELLACKTKAKQS
jgi:type I restriction enzyme M protein